MESQPDTLVAYYRTFSAKKDDIVEIGFDIEGSGQVEFFYGANDGVPHFGTYEISCCPFDFDLDTCEAAMRFSSVHILEPRKDGYIYDVTYKYPEPWEKDKEYFSFSDVVYLESIGKRREAHKLFLEYNKDDTESPEYKIISDCQKKDKPFHVQSEDDVIDGWEIYHLYR